MAAVTLGIIAALGAGASMYGSSQSARTANNTARDVRDVNKADVLNERDRMGTMLFGPGWTGMTDYNKANPYWSADQKNAWNQFSDSIGGSLYGQFNKLNTEAAAKAGQVQGMYDAETAKLMGSADNYTRQIRGMYSGGPGSVLGDFDKGAAGVSRMEDSFGQARDKAIRRDAERDLTRRNDATRATLAASGFGNSTALPAALSANAQAVGESRDAALTDLTGRKAALGQGLLTQRAGLATQGAAATERALGSRQTLEQNRSDNSFNLKQADIANQLRYKSAPLDFAYSALGGSKLSPFSDQGGSLPLPSYSPTGVAASTGGNAAAGMASMLLMQKLMGGGGGGAGYGSYGGQMDQMYAANR